MNEYFKLIRQSIQENRKKKNGIYYESHHIIPKSFGKKSSTVLLTPEEHYLAHKYLAEYWKDHSIYGQKMLWAFHRLAYDKGRKLTKEQYAEARKLLITLWERPKNVDHKEKISIALRGNSNNSSRVFKGMKSDMTEEGRQRLSMSISNRNIGKKLAAKGPYKVTFEDGRVFEGSSFQDIVNQCELKLSSLHSRLTSKKGIFIKGWKIE